MLCFGDYLHEESQCHPTSAMDLGIDSTAFLCKAAQLPGLVRQHPSGRKWCWLFYYIYIIYLYNIFKNYIYNLDM